jgi:hypothetical protein
VKKLGISVLLSFAIPATALACRTPYHTHAQRLGAAEQAAIARVSGVQSAALERDSYDETQLVPTVVEGERTIRLVVLRRLKGHPPKLIELTLDHCRGSLSAEFGGLVAVYKIHGEWRVDDWPPEDRVIEVKPRG